nr:MAG TPA: hypothetical protein [Caudoviricetes sp.]
MKILVISTIDSVVVSRGACIDTSPFCLISMQPNILAVLFAALNPTTIQAPALFPGRYPSGRQPNT